MKGFQRLAQLGFFSVWLTGWSVGVAFIQYSLAMGEWDVLLFLFTHGGAEVGVLYWLSRTIRGEAVGGARGLDVQLDHDGVHAAWTIGDASVLYGAVAAALGLVAHVLVIGGPVAAAVEGHPLLLLIVPVWLVTAGLWASACLQHLRGSWQVRVEADLDGVTVEQTRRGERVRHALSLDGLVVRGQGDELSLTATDGTQVTLACEQVPARDELIELLGLMAERYQAPVDAPVPEQLAAMRSGQAG